MLKELVTRETFGHALAYLSQCKELAIDTETTGLNWQKNDCYFSIIIGDDERIYYFNFNIYKDGYKGIEPMACYLGSDHAAQIAELCAANPDRVWYLVNAKFDLHMLSKGGIELVGTIHCCSAVGRLVRNDLFAYNMDGMASRWLGEEKDDFQQYLNDEGLFTKVQVSGSKKTKKLYHYNKAPLEKIVPYGLKDVDITFRLGRFQTTAVEKIDASRKMNVPPLAQVVDSERKLTPVLYKMEQEGLVLDLEYVKEAHAYETKRYKKAEADFTRLTGDSFVDHPARFAKHFRRMGLEFPRTEKGGPSFPDAWLATQDNELAKAIRAHRASYKKAVTYFGNFLEMRGSDDRIHADLVQYGTQTGRFSCRNPNMQNMEKQLDASERYHVRKSFVPPPGFCFFMPDFDQMEYRLMLDYAGEMPVIEEVNSGVDVHTATAERVQIERQHAKTVNFLLLYGGGIGKLAGELGISWNEAKELIALYFARLPRVQAFIERVRHVAESRRWTFNWWGRRYQWAPGRSVYTTAPNYLIQGGCADVVKIAMIRCDGILRGMRSKMVLQVHDELIFHLHQDELHVAPKIVEIMESVYPFKHLQLTASAEHSWKNLAEKSEGFPVVQ